MAVPWTHNPSSTETQKITKYENLALEIKNIWKLNHGPLHRSVISTEAVVTKNFLKYVQNTGLIENILSGAKATTITNVSHSMQIPRTRRLTLRDRMNFLPLTEPNPTENVGRVKVCQHVDTGR
jgi:hypothetical protein